MIKISRREAMQKGGQIVMGAAAGAFCQPFLSGCANSGADQESIAQTMEKTANADIENIKLTVVYDNFSYNGKLKTDWGFSCLVEGLDRTVLFDAGRYTDVFMSNMSILGIDPRGIDEVVISHDHPDHIGGVMKILEIRPDITITLVKSFRSGYKSALRERGARVVEIEDPGMVTKNCISTGEMKSFIRNEHALVIRTNKGAILLTGCAHPGVVEIIERAKKITNQEVLLAAGGFHLLSDYGSSLEKIVVRLKELGVRYAAPTHCSGGEAREIIAKAYGRGFLNCGVGRVITSDNLT